MLRGDRPIIFNCILYKPEEVKLECQKIKINPVGFDQFLKVRKPTPNRKGYSSFSSNQQSVSTAHSSINEFKEKDIQSQSNDSMLKKSISSPRKIVVTLKDRATINGGRHVET